MRARGLMRIVVMTIVTSIWCAPLFRHPRAWATTEDWEYFQAWLEIARRTILHFGDLPLWKPYTCGGQPHLAHPQTIITSPQFVLVLLFGTALGAKLVLWSVHFLALDGAHRLARRVGASEAAAWCAALVYAGCGWLTLQNAVGHLPSAGGALLPYLVLCFDRALDERRAAIGVGLIALWILSLGGTATPAIAAVLLAVLAIVAAVRRRSGWPLLLLVAGAVVCLAVGAARLFPVFEALLEHPRGVPESDRVSPLYLLGNALRAPYMSVRENTQYRYYEYAWRVPLLALPLAAVGAAQRRARPYVIVALVGFAIAVGDAWPYGPWWLLRQLPVFSDLRVPSRYLLLVDLSVAVLAALGLDWILTRLATWRPRAPAVAGWTIALVITVDAGHYVRAQYRDLFTNAVALVTPWPRIFQVQGVALEMLSYVAKGQGVLRCWEDGPAPRAFELDEGDVAQARVIGDPSGVVEVVAWSPSTIKLRARLARAARVLVNQNWSPHWRASIGTVVPDPAETSRPRTVGRIAIDLPAGDHDLTLAYRPRSFYVGIATTLLALAGLAFWWFRARARGTGRCSSA